MIVIAIVVIVALSVGSAYSFFLSLPPITEHLAHRAVNLAHFSYMAHERVLPRDHDHQGGVGWGEVG